jgi:hypothetical protein
MPQKTNAMSNKRIGVGLNEKGLSINCGATLRDM